MKEKIQLLKAEQKALKSIPKSKLTPEQKERLKELGRQLAKLILEWLLQLVTLGLLKRAK